MAWHNLNNYNSVLCRSTLNNVISKKTAKTIWPLEETHRLFRPRKRLSKCKSVKIPHPDSQLRPPVGSGSERHFKNYDGLSMIPPGPGTTGDWKSMGNNLSAGLNRWNHEWGERFQFWDIAWRQDGQQFMPMPCRSNLKVNWFGDFVYSIYCAIAWPPIMAESESSW